MLMCQQIGLSENDRTAQKLLTNSNGTFIRCFEAEESRHSQMQRMAAMMSATQLTPIGIW